MAQNGLVQRSWARLYPNQPQRESEQKKKGKWCHDASGGNDMQHQRVYTLLQPHLSRFRTALLLLDVIEPYNKCLGYLHQIGHFSHGFWEYSGAAV